MRIASVNIPRKTLEKLCKEHFGACPDAFMEAVDKSKITRFAVLSTKGKGRKAAAVISPNVDKFQAALMHHRETIKHKPRRIHKGDKSYNTLCQISSDCDEFCRTYEVTYAKGHLEYIRLGFKLIGKNYQLVKFRTYKEKIFELYQRKRIISLDENKKKTTEIANTYYSKIGLFDTKLVKENFKDYRHDFVYCREMIDVYNADITDWMNAQFEYFQQFPDEQTGKPSKPKPYQLHTSNAGKRYSDYKLNQ